MEQNLASQLRRLQAENRRAKRQLRSALSLNTQMWRDRMLGIDGGAATNDSGDDLAAVLDATRRQYVPNSPLYQDYTGGDDEAAGPVTKSLADQIVDATTPHLAPRSPSTPPPSHRRDGTATTDQGPRGVRLVFSPIHASPVPPTPGREDVDLDDLDADILKTIVRRLQREMTKQQSDFEQAMQMQESELVAAAGREEALEAELGEAKARAAELEDKVAALERRHHALKLERDAYKLGGAQVSVGYSSPLSQAVSNTWRASPRTGRPTSNTSNAGKENAGR